MKFIVLFGLILLASAGPINKPRKCDQTDSFEKQSFELAYFPPGDSDVSMAILVGTFPQDTFVSDVMVSHSRNGGHWKDYTSNINATYVATQLVQFAPWFQLKASQSGDYKAIISIEDHTSQIYCWPFDFSL